MAHPDLYDELAQDLIASYDAGITYARIDDKRGLVWQHAQHGGMDDALPREQLLIASVLQQFIEEGAPQGHPARWQSRNGVNGILWTDENQWMPLSDIGVNKQFGFYQLSVFPDQTNDAGGY